MSAMRAGSCVLWASTIVLELCDTVGEGRCAAQQLVVSESDSAGRSAAIDSVIVIPGARYRAGALHRWLLGANYRDSWTTPLQVSALNLATFAGGLRVVGVGGGLETNSLRLEGRDGREYRFRSVDKDPTRALPADLKSPFVESVVQDNVSAEYPGAPAMIPRLLSATHVLHVVPQLFIMPDDPTLGAHRARFRGILGFLEERPKTNKNGGSFARATRIVDTGALLKAIAQSPADRVDARAYLAARLMDVYIGDWDRGEQQWLWARYKEADVHVWEPIPRDRDRAFTKMDGLLPWVARRWNPKLMEFGGEYPRMLGLMKNSWLLDRRLLQELDLTVWDSTAVALRRALTDSVIDDAVMHLPPALRARRRLVRAGAAAPARKAAEGGTSVLRYGRARCRRPGDRRAERRGDLARARWWRRLETVRARHPERRRRAVLSVLCSPLLPSSLRAERDGRDPSLPRRRAGQCSRQRDRARGGARRPHSAHHHRHSRRRRNRLGALGPRDGRNAGL